MNEAVTIRPACSQDAAGLALVGSATMLETYAGKIPGADLIAHCRNRHGEAFYAAWLADARNAIWIAETPTGAPVGYLVLMPSTLAEPYAQPSDREVQRIYLLSQFHGSGAGRRMMDHAVTTARADGARRLVLGVLKANTRAVAFYQRQGFGVIGARRFTVGTSVFDDHVMGRLC